MYGAMDEPYVGERDIYIDIYISSGGLLWVRCRSLLGGWLVCVGNAY